VTGFTGAPEYRSVFAWPRPRTRQAESPDGATLTGFSHRHDPRHSSHAVPGLIASPHAAPYIAAGRPTIYGYYFALPELSGVA